MSKRSPTLTEVLSVFGQFLFDRIHTCLPGQVIKYDYQTSKAEVKPCLKQKFSDGTTCDLPVVVNVPVVWPRAGNSMIHFPLKKDDYVLLVFCERSLDFWLSKGGTTEPGDVRQFDLTDGIAIPGLYPFSSSSPATDNENVQIVSGDAIIKMKPSGQVDINNGNLTVEK